MPSKANKHCRRWKLHDASPLCLCLPVCQCNTSQKTGVWFFAGNAVPKCKSNADNILRICEKKEVVGLTTHQQAVNRTPNSISKSTPCPVLSVQTEFRPLCFFHCQLLCGRIGSMSNVKCISLGSNFVLSVFAHCINFAERLWVWRQSSDTAAVVGFLVGDNYRNIKIIILIASNADVEPQKSQSFRTMRQTERQIKMSSPLAQRLLRLQKAIYYFDKWRT